MATARQFLLFRQTKQNNKIPRLGDFLLVVVSCKCPAVGSTLRGTIIQLLIHHTGTGRYLLFYVFIVFNIQAQGAARTQWIPAVAGMTTVFNIYFFKHRHTGAGRYPLFHGFLCLSLRANASLRGNPVSCIHYLYSQTGSPRLRRAMTRVCKGQVQGAARTQWIPACAGMTTVFKFYLFKHRHTGAGRYPLPTNH